MKHLIAIATVATLVPSAGVGADSPEPALLLICQAAGDVVQQTRRYENTPGPDGKSSLQLQTRQNVVRQEVRYEVAIEGGSGRLRPDGGSGGLFATKTADGWLPIDRLVVGETAIEGRVKLGFLETATLRIDRRTGGFTVDSLKGSCERIPTERKF